MIVRLFHAKFIEDGHCPGKQPLCIFNTEQFRQFADSSAFVRGRNLFLKALLQTLSYAICHITENK